MKTLLGTELPETTRGVFYICELHSNSITVIQEFISDNSFEMLEKYANTRNPESQLAIGKTWEELNDVLDALHRDMANPAWCEEQWDYI